MRNKFIKKYNTAIKMFSEQRLGGSLQTVSSTWEWTVCGSEDRNQHGVTVTDNTTGTDKVSLWVWKEV